MTATARGRRISRSMAYVSGALILGTLAVPMSSARAQLTLVDFGVTSLPPSSTAAARMSAPYARSVLIWPGAARLPVVMP